MQIDTQGEYMLVVAEKGLGKLTPMEGFPVQRRGGMGIKCHNVNAKTGDLMSIKAVNLQDSVMMITTEGIMIRFPCSSISIQGRITSGVRLMNLAENVTVAGVAKVAIPDDEEETEDPDGAEQPENAGEETPEDGTEERQENIVDEDVPEEENDL
jgi:DNA gyrase subunit A